MGDGEIPAVCGNGVVEEGEECDDGNRLDRDGCSSTCTVESCGATTCPNGCCDAQGECRKGSNDDTCGVGGESCADCTAQGLFCQDFDCQALGDCEPGDTMECGNCGTRTCTSDRVWGACEGAGDCSPGQSEIIGACGNCGELERTCNTSCTWGSTTCINEGPCAPNDVEQGTSCGDCAVNERVCNPTTCQWGGWECVTYGECSPGDVDDTGADCGNCGHEERTCTVDCDWGDWICTEEGDCQPGAHSSQGCGPCGTKTCTSQCTWGACESPPEECNAIDDDCDGQTDEIFECIQGTQGTCNTSCNTEGVHTCSSGCTWGTCQPPSETCNGIDDDCDGDTDEGHRFSYHNTTFTTLSSYDSACDGTTERWGPDCNHAIHSFCAAQGCPQSGFGPVENLNDDAAAVCIASVDIIQTTYTILSTHHPPCDGINSRMGQGCNAAFKRFCTSQGYVSGYGPVNENGDNATVVCLTSGINVHTTYTELSTHHPPCDGTNQRVGLHCNAAINRYCASIGHSGGFGPIENNGDDCWVTCVYP